MQKDECVNPQYEIAQEQERVALQSMYFLPGEYLEEIRPFSTTNLSTNTKSPTQSRDSDLVRIITISIFNTENHVCEIEFKFEIPWNYPDHSPNLNLHLANYHPDLKENLLNCANNCFINNIGQVCIVQCIENIKELYENLQTSYENNNTESSTSEDDDTTNLSEFNNPHTPTQNHSHTHLLESIPILGRRLCFSHHILATSKRRCIINWALELELCGMSKIGYPGIVIVEGPESHCYEYVNRLQRLRWKHFVCRGEQTIEGKIGQTIDDLRTLPRGFIELGSSEMGQMAEVCKMAGISELFMTSMKIYKKDDVSNVESNKPKRKKKK